PCHGSLDRRRRDGNRDAVLHDMGGSIRRQRGLSFDARRGHPAPIVQSHLTMMIWLLAVLAVATAIGPRLPVPMPVVLALAGAALAFVPEVPHLKLDPDLILIGFLPPLLYADAFDTSWI